MDSTNPSNNPAGREPSQPLAGRSLSAQRAASLQRVTAALNTTLISSEVATLALEEAVNLLNATAGSIMLLRDQGETVEIVAFIGYSAGLPSIQNRFSIHTHPPILDAIQGHPLFFGSKRAFLKRYPQTAATINAAPNEAFAFLPLPLDNNVIGAFTLSFPQSRSFPAGERAYLKTLAQQTARAFARARLYETEQASRHRAEQAAQQMAALQSITAALAQAVTLAEVSQVTIEQTARVIGANASAIGWRDGNHLNVTHSQGVDIPPRWRHLPLDTPIILTEAVHTGQPIFIETPEEAARRYPSTIEVMLSGGRGAWLAIPLPIEGQVIGSIGLGFNQPRPFTSEDRIFMQAVGQQCAQALHRAQLYEKERAARTEADHLNTELEQRVATRTAELQWTNAELTAEISQRLQAENLLRESESRYRTLIETSPDAIILTDLNMKLLFGNQQAAALLGYGRIEDLIGRNAFDLIAPQSHDYAQAVLGRALTHGRVANAEVTLRRQNGTLFPAEISGSLLTDANGRPTAFLTITRDITQRKAAAERIQLETARTAALARAASRLTGRLELNELITAISEETATIFAAPLVIVSLYDSEQDALIIHGGYGLPDWFLAQARPIPAAAYQSWDYNHQGRTDRPFVIPDMRRLTHLPNHPLFVRLNVVTGASINMMREETFVGRLNVYTIGKERTFTANELQILELLAAQAAVAIQSAQLYAQLRANRQQLRWLNQRVITAQEDERQRLSRELHDSVGQMLTALNINLSLLAEDVSEENLTLRQNLLEATTLSKEALEQIRALARELRPVALGPTGLNAVLEAFCQEFSRRTRFPVTYEGIELPPLPDVVGISFYRFLQEGLTNVVKHANATQAQVTLTWHDGLISLTVADNGQGIATVTGNTQQPAGVGLIGLRERFELLGGEIQLHSTPGQGARLTARLKPDLPPP